MRVTTFASFLRQWLLPRVAQFGAAHPEIDLHLHTSNETADFVREDFHLAIRLGHGEYPNVHSEKLLDKWVLPVCTPAPLDKYGPVNQPEDVRGYPLLHSLSEPWTTWLFDGAMPAAPALKSPPLRGAVFEGSWATVRMAVQGAGLALARWSLVAEEIRSGLLVRASHWLVYPHRAEDLPPVRAFLHGLRAEAARFPTPVGPAFTNDG